MLTPVHGAALMQKKTNVELNAVSADTLLKSNLTLVENLLDFPWLKMCAHTMFTALC